MTRRCALTLLLCVLLGDAAAPAITVSGDFLRPAVAR